MAEPRKRWFGDFRAYEGKKIGWSKRTGGTGWKRKGDKWVQYKDGKPTGRTSRHRIGTTAISQNNPDQWKGSQKPDPKKNRGNLPVTGGNKDTKSKSKPKVKSVGTVDFNVNTAGGLAAYNKAKAAAQTSGAKTNQAKDKSTTEALHGERNRARAKKSNVFTRHYKTGKELGVMSRRQRRAYEKEADGRTFKGEVAKHEKASGHGQSHKRETLYKSSLRKKQQPKKKQLMVTNEKDTGPTKLVKGPDGKMRRVKA